MLLRYKRSVAGRQRRNGRAVEGGAGRRAQDVVVRGVGVVVGGCSGVSEEGGLGLGARGCCMFVVQMGGMGGGGRGLLDGGIAGGELVLGGVGRWGKGSAWAIGEVRGRCIGGTALRRHGKTSRRLLLGRRGIGIERRTWPRGRGIVACGRTGVGFLG